MYTSLEMRTAHFSSAFEVISFLICIFANIVAILVLIKMISVVKKLVSYKIKANKSQRFVRYKRLREDLSDYEGDLREF